MKTKFRRVFDRRELPFYFHLISDTSDSGLVNAIRENFKKVKCYHQCRPIDPSVYLSEGIKLPDHNSLDQFIYDTYNSYIGKCSFDEVKLAGSKLNRRDEGICVSLEYEFGLAYASHYLVYGSEYAACVLIRMNGGIENRNVLKRIGVPTLFQLEIPINQVSDDDCLLLAGQIVQHYEEKDSHKVPYSVDCCLEITNPIQGKWITDHWHPKRICDQLDGDTVHQNENVSCKICSG